MVNEIEQLVREAGLEDKYELASEKDSDLEKNLLKIKEHYVAKKTCYSKKCDATAQHLLMTILTEAELKEIHSARYRTKTVESLWGKYIKKKALLPQVPGHDYNIEKYRPMNKSNYYKIITDLIGIRILIRYQQQWEIVHQWIWNNFFKSEKPYIKNWLDDYPAGDTEDFIAEKPKLYLRSEKELPLYQKFGKDVFEHYISDEGYSSIHYLLWYDEKYVELQVRTIYDEAWGECTHDLVYKCQNKSQRADLEELSKCLATQTQAAGMIADIMFDKAQGMSVKDDENVSLELQQLDGSKTDTYNKLEARIRKMNESKAPKEEFDGSIDSLI